MLKKIEPDKVRELLAALPATRQTELVELPDALGRILAEDVYTAFPLPPFAKSAFDGFAFRAADVPGTLRIDGFLPAGVQDVPSLQPGCAARIFTGAPIPVGADAVIRFEETNDTGTHVTIDQSFQPDSNIVAAGEECPAGTLLAAKGQRLGTSHIGMLATQGLNQIPVYKKPKAVLIATGSELSAPGTERPHYGIYDCNSYTVSSYLRQLGFDVCIRGIVADEAAKIAELALAAMDSDADLVLTTGGASVGDFDYAVNTAESIGAKVLFWKVRMKPGGALLVAERMGKAFFGLSGNPAAALTSLLTVLLPYVLKLTGVDHPPEPIMLPLYRPMPKSSNNTRMLRGCMILENGKAYFQENLGQGNGTLSSFADCTMMGVIPPDSGPLEAGTMITVYPLPTCLH